ncbi:MAG: hypothetical protein ED559_10470 [Phycisphaera sp.]|nr:MAG: hypothetical protein ED559_10470 [Phycisphaera sp.]
MPGDRAQQQSSSDHQSQYATAALRLLDRLARYKKSQGLSRPLKLLDVSGGKPDLLRAFCSAASKRSLPVEMTVLAESETVSQLLTDVESGFTSIDIEPDTLDVYVERASVGEFDCVHAALCLTQLREVPMLTRLGKLERLSSPLFVWTDLHRGAKRKHYRDIMSRVDLGFCDYKKPLRSPVFTITGERKPFAPITRSEPGAVR